MSSEKSSESHCRTLKSRVSKTKLQSTAAQWNMAQYRKLGAALKKDPEASIVDLLSTTYPKRLKSLKFSSSSRCIQNAHLPYTNDVRSKLVATEPCTIIHDLSAEVQELFNSGNLSESLLELLYKGDILFQTACVMVLKIGGSIAVKMTQADTLTEYHSLCYLQQHLPAFPAPRPHGLLQLNGYNFLFMTFIPGIDLENAWPGLEADEKQAVCDDLGELFSLLRSIPFSHGTPFGGVGGEGCKDIRRDLRMNSEPIYDEEAFQDFVFSGIRSASPLYTNLLRSLMPPTSAKCVFTHGDIRPANIMVKKDLEGKWKVAAIIDWEASGFYPEYWESFKMTNNLTPRDENDWYMYLPAGLSLRQYPLQWLIDRVWDPLMINS
ncbi:arabinan endo- -alpha-l-arabinosidase a protein [Fusarium langsethiae]|uniref:Arabinan endo--alpha-l-arabinosidase a protein n=1 Tax=Fusarium langsethiae TaxID=179993 RepID=A0A0M9ENX4_FUSLA|nr:arabinan endo- -alpha-l-arabinosidase a protein [Fusarium langsethiae]